MRRPVPSYRLYREDSGESAEFWIHCETLPARSRLHNWEIAAHRHEGFFQIFGLTRGHGEMLHGGAYMPFRAPCALFVPPGAVHGFRFARETDGLVMTALADRLESLVAADRQIAAFAAATRIVPLPAGKGARPAVLDCLARIDGDLAGEAAGRTVLLEALTTATIVHLARAAGAPAEGEGADDRDGRRIEALQTLVGAHFRERRPAAFYADRLGISAGHLNRLARAFTGHSVQSLVARRVLEAARRDLVFTPTPVQAIAYSLGFSDPAYFNRFFRRMTGTTPGEFRRAERGRLAVGSGV